MHTTPTAATGANVRAEMARQGVTQADLAARLHVSQTQVSARLRGRVPFDVNELVLIAATLGVPLAALLPDTTTEAGRPFLSEQSA